MAARKNREVANINTAETSYSWQIQNFKDNGKAAREYISSPTFSVGSNENVQWSLQLYPKGYNCKCLFYSCYHSMYVGLFLQLLNNNNEQTKIEADIEFSILNLYGQKVNQKQIVHSFTKYSKVGGDSCFIGTREIWQHLVNGNITIMCNIRAGFDEDYLPHLTPVPSAPPPPVPTPSTSSSSIQSNLEKLSNDFEKLFETQTFGDITLAASGTRMQAHKAILSARSPVFAALLSHEMKETKEELITIEDVEPDTLKEMLHFIYTGKVEKLDKLAYELLHLSDKYALDGLKEICEDFLSHYIAMDNAIDILVYADLYSARILKKKSLRFVKKHAPIIINTCGYKNLERTNSPLISEILRATLTSCQYRDT